MHALVSSRLDCCNSLLTPLSSSTISRLQLVQNAAARLLTGTPRRAHITPALASPHWLPIHCRIYFKILLMTFKALCGLAPLYSSELLSALSTSGSSRTLGSSARELLAENQNQGKATTLHNPSPPSVKRADSVDTFKNSVPSLEPSLSASTLYRNLLAPHPVCLLYRTALCIPVYNLFYRIPSCELLCVYTVFCFIF